MAGRWGERGGGGQPKESPEVEGPPRPSEEEGREQKGCSRTRRERWPLPQTRVWNLDSSTFVSRSNSSPEQQPLRQFECAHKR